MIVIIHFSDAPDMEFRSMFIATAFNVDWPTYTGQDSDAQKEQMVAFLDAAERLNMNAVMFQVQTLSFCVFNN